MVVNSRFDHLSRLVGTAPSRRALLPLLGGALAFPVHGILPAGAKNKKKKGKKSTLCLDGQTVQVSKKKKKSLLKRGATAGACVPPPPGCTPTCAGNTCGGDDGCDGICGCAAGSLCYSGVCHACDVSCSGNGTACGNELKTILTSAGGRVVYACPGRYVGNFELGNGALIGAGQGEDPATNTILDANGNGGVVLIKPTIITALHGLRITGGNVLGGAGGGINNIGSLTVTACTIDQNRASNGGGIVFVGTKLNLTNCTVSRNTTPGDGGGVYTFAPGSLMTITGSAFTGNTATGKGGGLYIQHPATFDSACSITGNTATGNGGGIHSAAGAVTLGGATVSDNSAPQCVNVAGC